MSDGSSNPSPTWLSAAELAGKPGMPGTPRSVRRRADAEGWQCADKPVPGGIQRVYALETLPEATRAALGAAANDAAAVSLAAQSGAIEGAKARLQEDMTNRSRQARRQAALRQSAQLTPSRQAVMDAKLAILRERDVWLKAHNTTVTHGAPAFVAAYNAGQVNVQAGVRQAVDTISVRSLARWEATVRTAGIAALAGAYGNRAGAGRLDVDQELHEFVVAMLVKYPHCHASHIQHGLDARFGVGNPRFPSGRTLQRWITDWRQANAQTVMALENPDAWKNNYMAAFGSRSEGIDRINQLWELDSTPGDVMLIDGRHSVIGTIDVKSRRMKLLVSKTSRAVAVAALFRRALLDFGVPESAKTDNGSDYVSNHMQRVFSSLDIKHLTCEPFSPWQKPHIERGLGSFSHALVELLPNFIGHDVAERSAIEARNSFADRLMKRGEVVAIQMTSSDFQEFCDQWTDNIYHHDHHAGLNGQTPFQVAAAARDTIRRIADERTLDVLLAAAPGGDGWRVVGKKGISLDRGHYIAPELEAWIGQRVRVLYDEVDHDLGRVFVFGGDDLRFICAAECPERTGVDRREVAIHARELQKARVQEERKQLKAVAKRAGVDQVVDEILRSRAEAAGKLASLPAPTEQHTSAGLDAAALAADALVKGPSTSADVLAIDGVAEHWLRIREQVEADEREIPKGTDNEFARRRAAAGSIEAPAFESTQQRCQWLLEQQHYRDLSGEERTFLASYKRDHLASYRRMESVAAELHSSERSDEEESRWTGTSPASE